MWRGTEQLAWPRQMIYAHSSHCKADIRSAVRLSKRGKGSLPSSIRCPHASHKGCLHCPMIMNPLGICYHLNISEVHAAHVIAVLAEARRRMLSAAGCSREQPGSRDHSIAILNLGDLQEVGLLRMLHALCMWLLIWPELRVEAGESEGKKKSILLSHPSEAQSRFLN